MGYIKINGIGPVTADDVVFVLKNSTDKVRITYTSGKHLTVTTAAGTVDADVAGVQAALEAYQANQEGPIITAATATASSPAVA
jgi:hypothetical protein